ncbi:hypothetical protein HLB23_02855 [Nocardia uniformis]|uniref:DUF5753 domain-containing protein n=1 Tax=Nocardia uniformis TaxID=53432 RepID=A0A849BQF5_9NOCA|nr:Scr1 family TA system antitoxin-like transcriptional regulator [Nocardia uniformis]NNH68823.1 hypothetical protein [Nocardia uniformis]
MLVFLAEKGHVAAQCSIGILGVDPPGKGVLAVDGVHIGYPNQLSRDTAAEEMCFTRYEHRLGIRTADTVDQSGDPVLGPVTEHNGFGVAIAESGGETSDVGVGPGRGARAMSLPRVVLGIVPTQSDYLVPQSNFCMFDRKKVLVETITAELTITQPRELALYEKTFRTLADQAAIGKAARGLVRKSIEARCEKSEKHDA